MRNVLVASVLALAFVVPASEGSAQTPDRQSAFGLDPRDYGGFVGLNLHFGDMMDDFAAFMGGHAALLLKQRVYLGVGGIGLVTDESRVAAAGQTPGPAIRMGYGGLLVGYIVPTRSLVQFTAETLLAGGGVSLAADDDTGDDEDWDGIFVFEPALGAELKLARVVRLGFGVGYRFVGGVDTTTLRDTDLRGVTGTATLRVGWF